MDKQEIIRNCFDLVGKEIGVGDWFVVTQELVDGFANLTHDMQFIHVDPVLAAHGPFGTTIAHGYLVLALLPHLAELQKNRSLSIPHKASVNYGLNRVRFIDPVRIPSEIRLRTTLLKLETPTEDTVRLFYGQTVDVRHSEKPALYAESITQLVL